MMSSLGELVVETGMIPSTEIHAEHYHNDLIGSSIIGLWSLPDSIVEAVLHQSDKEIPTDQLSAMLILHAVRSIENVFRENEGHLDNNFTVENTLSRYDLPAGLAQKWFDCFCDYQLDLRQAA
jgi:HD-like signal output (HDOD) protein